MILDTVINGDCFDKIKDIPNNSIDLVVTSPPYAEKRKGVYGGVSADQYADWLFNLSEEIMRVLKPTGSFILNVKEGAKNGHRELYVLEYQLMMAKKYIWADTFIWAKTNPYPTGNKRRLKDGFEYCFQFTKTNKYKFFPNNVLVQSTSKWLSGQKKRKNKGAFDTKNGSGLNMSTRICEDYVRPSNVITFPSSCINIAHCAVFPIDLPNFFIKLMTEEQDVVLDPFMGSGTTALAAIQNNRHYIGIEQKEEYCNIIQKRLM